MATGLRLTEREGAFQPILEKDEMLMNIVTDVTIVLGNRQPEYPGTLFISTKQIVWLSDTDRAKGYAVNFVSVSRHALLTDPEAYRSPCIYTQIENGAEDDSEDSDSKSNETLDLSKITEMRLVPDDPYQLDALFSVFCECAELNRDTMKEGEYFWNDCIVSADQLEVKPAEYEYSEYEYLEWGVFENPSIDANGHHDLVHSVGQVQINDQRIEDAEEMEENDKNGHN